MTNRVQDAFNSITADTELKESTKRFLNKKYQENICPRRRKGLRLTASFACAVLLFVMGAAGYSWVQMPVSYVSIDVNPSIELALNRFDRVVAVTAYNPEGEEIVNGLSLKGKKYTEAIHEVVECDGMRAYLSGSSEVVLTVAAEESREPQLDRGVRRCAGHMGQGCHNACADISVISQAHECGLSFGKYNAYLKLLEYDSSITADDCKDMSMAQIRELIREYESGSQSDGESTAIPENSRDGNEGSAGKDGNGNDSGNGSGCGNGNGNGNGNGSGYGNGNGNGNGNYGGTSPCKRRHHHRNDHD